MQSLHFLAEKLLEKNQTLSLKILALMLMRRMS
jgi:hypothetical protein